MRELRDADFRIYIQALGVYFKNPVIALVPLAAGLANVLLSIGFSGTIAWLFSILLNLCGLAVAVIIADYAWRARGDILDQAWNDARRKAGDILVASLGVVFVIALPSLFGSIFGPLVPLLQAVAFTFVIYTIPAAAIGGTPGGAALQASVDRTRAFPVTSIVLFLICYGAYACAQLIAGVVIQTVEASIDGSIASPIAWIISAFTRALSIGYIALVLARVYIVTSYGRRY